MCDYLGIAVPRFFYVSELMTKHKFLMIFKPIFKRTNVFPKLLNYHLHHFLKGLKKEKQKCLSVHTLHTLKLSKRRGIQECHRTQVLAPKMKSIPTGHPGSSGNPEKL